MVYFSNYLYFFLNSLLEILLVFYAPLWYWPLVSHDFAGVVFAGTGVDNLVHLALISLSKLFDQSIYDLTFLFILAGAALPTLKHLPTQDCTQTFILFLSHRRLFRASHITSGKHQPNAYLFFSIPPVFSPLPLFI